MEVGSRCLGENEIEKAKIQTYWSQNAFVTESYKEFTNQKEYLYPKDTKRASKVVPTLKSYWEEQYDEKYVRFRMFRKWMFDWLYLGPYMCLRDFRLSGFH